MFKNEVLYFYIGIIKSHTGPALTSSKPVKIWWLLTWNIKKGGWPLWRSDNWPLSFSRHVLVFWFFPCDGQSPSVDAQSPSCDAQSPLRGASSALPSAPSPSACKRKHIEEKLHTKHCVEGATRARLLLTWSTAPPLLPLAFQRHPPPPSQSLLHHHLFLLPCPIHQAKMTGNTSLSQFTQNTTQCTAAIIPRVPLTFKCHNHHVFLLPAYLLSFQYNQDNSPLIVH